MNKKCSSCRSLKLLSEFRKCSRNKDGLDSRCRDCASEADARFRESRKKRNIIQVMKKKCSQCGEVKKSSEFHKDSISKDGLVNRCKDCRNEYSLNYYNAQPESYHQHRANRARENRRKNRISYMYASAKSRAKRNGLDFNIEKSDIVLNNTCPMLGIDIQYNVDSLQDNSPALDRVDNSKGYVKGNIVVVSHRANMLKRDATMEELEKILLYMEKHQVEERD